jgi:hypothetical protein
MAALALASTTLLVGCAPGTDGTLASASPGASSPNGSPAGDVIGHPSGSSDVILQLETGGGFVPMDFAATQAPTFTLYGDGTVIVRDEGAPFPEPAADGVSVLPAVHVASLAESEVQELLRYALTDGGLGIARARYDLAGISDAGSTYLTIDAGGLDKRVEIYALSETDPSRSDVQDAPIRAAFWALAERLRLLATTIARSSPGWEPDRWRGTLEEWNGVAFATRPWPWTDLALTDFTVAPGNSAPSRVLSMAQVQQLDLPDLGGGVMGIALRDADGMLRELTLRPLFPDETT